MRDGLKYTGFFALMLVGIFVMIGSLASIPFLVASSSLNVLADVTIAVMIFIGGITLAFWSGYRAITPDFDR